MTTYFLLEITNRDTMFSTNLAKDVVEVISSSAFPANPTKTCLLATAVVR